MMILQPDFRDSPESHANRSVSAHLLVMTRQTIPSHYFSSNDSRDENEI